MKSFTTLLLLSLIALATTARAADGALSFTPASSQYVEVPNFHTLGVTNEVTIEFWALTNAMGNHSAFMLETDDDANRCQMHTAWSDGKTYWDFGDTRGDTRGSGRLSVATPSGTEGVWTHWAVVASSAGNFMKIYRDGVEVATKTGMSAFNVSTARTLRIGGNTGSFFNGLLDEFRVWNVARSAADIAAHRNLALTGGEAGLRLCLRFDEASGTTALNSATATGAAYDGTLVNAPVRTDGINATFTVTTTADAGAGSLRQAIADANAAPGTNTILFHSALSGQTITLAPSSAAIFTDASRTTVDGTTLASPLTLSGAGATRLLRLASGASVTLKKLILSAGNGADTTATGHGGAIYSQGALAVEDCVFTNNTVTGDGGAIRATASAPLTVTRCTFSGNSSGTASQFGGAIYSESPVVIALSTFSGNTSYRGGAVRVQHASLTASQSTFTGNTAVIGGALSFGGSGGASSLTHVTITANHATGTAGLSGGGIQCGADAGWTLANSIVSANTAGTGAADIDNQDPLTYVGANLVQTVVNTAAGTVTGPAPSVAAPLLAALGNYGGPTPTMPPLTGSPAINAAIGSTITTDQRGATIAGTADLGACEQIVPVINDLADLAIFEDDSAASRTVAVTIGNGPASAVLSAVSSNTAIVSGFTYGGSGVNRTLLMTLPANVSGSATITVTISTGAATASDSFLLTVMPSNDPPSFTKGPDQLRTTNAGAQSVPGWATALSTGPSDESGQSFLGFYLINNTNPALFSTPPAIALDGTLTYTLAAGVTGTAIISMGLRDSGSNTAPQVNFSTQFFTITVVDPAALIVSTTADSGAGSLRDQITAALAASTSQTLLIHPSLAGQTITLSSEIVLNDSNNANVLTIDGPAGGVTIHGGAGTNRIFSISAGDQAVLSDLTLTGGNGGGATSTGSGGAIYNAGTLTLTRCTLSGNTANIGGAIDNFLGAVNLRHCTFSGNSAIFGGVISSFATQTSPAAAGAITLSHCTLSGNTATKGGGIQMKWGSLSCDNSIIAANVDLNNDPSDFDIENTTISPGRCNLIGSNETVDAPGQLTSTNRNLVGTQAYPLNPQLEALGAYGGPTHTMRPLAGSRAINRDYPLPEIQTIWTHPNPEGFFSLSFKGASTASNHYQVHAAGYTMSILENELNRLPGVEAFGGRVVVTTVPGASWRNIIFDGAFFGETQPKLVPSDPTRIITTTQEVIAAEDQRGFPIGGSADSGACEYGGLGPVLPVTMNEGGSATFDITLVNPDGLDWSSATASTSSYYPELLPPGSIVVTGVGLSRTVTITPEASRFGTARVTLTLTAGSRTARTNFLLTVNPVNDPPTLDAISNPAGITEDTFEQMLTVTGIHDGDYWSQYLSVTAASNNTALIPHPRVVYNWRTDTALLLYTPVANAFGTAIITVTVNDGAATVSRDFTVTVNAVNDLPTLNSIANPGAISEDAAQQTVGLNGISAGPGESQPLTVTATSDNLALIPHPTVAYTSPNGAGTLTYTPVANASGTATISVTVSDGSATRTRAFTVTVNAVNDAPTLDFIANPAAINEDAAQQTVTIGGITEGPGESQPLTVTATSSNLALIPHPTVTYTSPDSTATLTYTPIANASGTATISVTVSDGQTTNSTFTRTFTVTVNAVNDLPTITAISARTINRDVTSGSIPFTVGDLETAAGSLTVTGSSSNQSVIANAGIVTSGAGAARAVTLTPVANASGQATITLTVGDGSGSATSSFLVTVAATNSPPTITTVTAPTFAEDSTSGELPFTVGDLETHVSSLTVTASSSDTALVAVSGISILGTAADRRVVLRPETNRFGTVTITLTVSDGLGSTSTSFLVTITEVNDPPSFHAIPTITLPPAGLAVAITGVSSGPFETQALTVSAVSSAPAVVPDPVVVYTSPAATGSLQFAPGSSGGTAIITVTLSDGGLEFTRTFLVLRPINPLSAITSVANSGPGSLRAAVAAAPPGASSLTIDPTLSGLTIDLLSEITVPPGVAITLDATPLPAGLTLRSAPPIYTRHFTVPATAGLSLRGFTLLGGTGDGEDEGGLAGSILNRGQLELSRCTMSGGYGQASAVYNFATATLDRCTLTLGEGETVLFTGPDATTTLTHCTLSGNIISFFTVWNTGHLRLGQSLIGGNSSGSDLELVNEGTLTRLGPSLISAVYTDQDYPVGLPNANGDYVGTEAAPLNPQLAALASNGGPTQTMALLPGSPAINRIASPLHTTDQRGLPIVGLADIGAYENGAPTLTAIADRVILANSNTGALAFTLGDVETAATSLTVTRATSNTTLLPLASIVLGGSGANRTVTLTPAAGQTGTATITLTVSDGANTTSTSFNVTVLPDTPYNSWKITTFGNNAGTPAIAGDTADFDNDGQSTFLEYATRGNPLAFTANPFSTPTQVAGPAYQFTFPYRPGVTDLRYIVQRSGTLSGWTEIYRLDLATNQITEQGNVTADENPTTQIITITDPDFTPGNCFWKLVVERP